MSLVEKLKVNYCNTDVLLKVIERDPANPYYSGLMALRVKQNADLVISDLEYESLPISGAANYWSAAHGYYHVNFHYNFFDPNFVNKEDLIDKFIDFLSVVDFIDCRESEVINWLSSFEYFIKNNKVSLAEHYLIKSKFIISILKAVNPIAKNTIEALKDIDRNTCSKLFDNAAWYLNFSNYCAKKLAEKYKDNVSFKAKEVMEILDISRQTLSTYVKQGLIKIDTVINGKYRYNKESVLNLVNL